MPIPSNNLERREPSEQEDYIVRTADTASRPLPASCSGKDGVDVASEDSFPASDAPSWTVAMGTGSPHRPERG
jgi:hypothetical protein